MNPSLKMLISIAIEKIINAIERHELNEIAPLSIELFLQTKKELEVMIQEMNPDFYMPQYPRFILDWPDDEGFIEELINIAYQYGKIKKK
ncbi:hypothetical protein [Pseudescherichia vulneris]|uniref:hypothetical protein n=1 Tax=Pseudescherichia vulneris TaxID=566 RepID=UPI0028A5AFAD|nr:hypothetical protein [Pseudescherichia vulneris]